MKTIKKILIAILVLLLVNIIFLLAISFNLKKVLIDGIIKETIVEKIIPNSYKAENSAIPTEQIQEITDDPRVQEMLNSPEVQQMMEKYLDTTVNGLIDDENIDEVALEEDMLNFIKDNKEVLEEKVGREITDEMINDAYEKLEGKDMSKAYIQSLKNASNNMTETEKKVLKGYKFIVSGKFRVILFIAMLLDLLLIALVQWSLYKWIKTFGKTLIASGICIIISSITSKMIVTKVSNFSNFNTSSLTITGIIITGTGIIIFVAYKVFLKLLKKDDKNEISKVSEEK